MGDPPGAQCLGLQGLSDIRGDRPPGYIITRRGAFDGCLTSGGSHGLILSSEAKVTQIPRVGSPQRILLGKAVGREGAACDKFQQHQLQGAPSPQPGPARPLWLESPHTQSQACPTNSDSLSQPSSPRASETPSTPCPGLCLNSFPERPTVCIVPFT